MKIIVHYVTLLFCFIVGAHAMEPIMESSFSQIQPQVAHEVNASMIESSSSQLESQLLHEGNGAFINMEKNTSPMDLLSSQMQPQLTNETLLNELNDTSIVNFTKNMFKNMQSLYFSWDSLVKRNHFLMSLALSQFKRTASHLFSENDLEKLSNQFTSVYRNVSSSNNLNLKSIINQMLSYNNNHINTSSVYTLPTSSSSNGNRSLSMDQGRQYDFYDDNYVSHDDSHGYMSYSGGGSSYGLDPYVLLAAMAGAAFIAATGWKVVHWKTMKKKRSVMDGDEYGQYNMEELMSLVWMALEKFQ